MYRVKRLKSLVEFSLDSDGDKCTGANRTAGTLCEWPGKIALSQDALSRPALSRAANRTREQGDCSGGKSQFGSQCLNGKNHAWLQESPSSHPIGPTGDTSHPSYSLTLRHGRTESNNTLCIYSRTINLQRAFESGSRVDQRQKCSSTSIWTRHGHWRLILRFYRLLTASIPIHASQD